MSVSLSPVSSPLAADVWQQALVRRQVSPLVADGLLIVGASLAIAGLAQVAVPLPFTPVPLTGQTFGILLAALLLGPRRATLSLLLYLAEGAAGLPVYTEASAGIAKLVGPTAGYLWSFPLAAWLVGTLAARGWDRKPSTTAAAMALGSLLILVLGASWLSLFVGSFTAAFTQGVAPFVIGEAIKMLLASALLPAGWKLLGRNTR